MTFIYYPGSRAERSRARVPALDWILVAAAVASLGWPLLDFERLVYRAAEPMASDVICGAVAIILVLEAARRTVGLVLPATAAAFLVYAASGPQFDRLGLPLLAHRGYDVERLVGTLYLTLEGIFGVPLDVTATYIILFTIYGAVLARTGAAAYFIDWAMAMTSGRGATAGRSVTLAGFLLGTVSGSGVATTVTLGSVAWPVLRRAGYTAERAGAMLSAAGIGALLSPPTLGAAAFLIAEFLRISYLQVLTMATVPTLLYYLSIFQMIEGDARAAASPDMGAPPPGTRALLDLRRGAGPFASLIAIATLMVAGMSAFMAVFWATLIAAGLSYLSRPGALTASRAGAALSGAGRDILGVAATTATAGIIVGVVTLTGLGLKIAGIIVQLAGGVPVLTVLYSGIAVWLLGLAVPVTASYIIAAVMIAPALVSAGVSDAAAHMFIFYYAVLSEVSPPTALSPFAAAALTGGNPYQTMLLTWRYTLPAFLVPLVFTLAPAGEGVLLRGGIASILEGTLRSAVGVLVLAIASGGWLRRPLAGGTRAAMGTAATLVLFAPRLWAAAAASVLMVVLILQFRQHTASRSI